MKNNFSRRNIFVLFLILSVSTIFSINVRAQEIFQRPMLLDLAQNLAISFEPQAVDVNAKINLLSSDLINLRQQTNLLSNQRAVRFLSDTTSNVVFGYEISAEQLTPEQFRLKLMPLPENFSLPPALINKSSLGGLRRRAVNLLTLSKQIVTENLNDGDALIIDLLVHPQLKIKIADKIRVSTSRQKLEPPSLSTPKDLTINDLELAIKNLKLRINEEEFLLSKASRTYAGSLIWLYLPPKGFFMLSLGPRDGYDFQKIGAVSNQKISFALKNEKYELLSESPIVSVDGTWNLWVLHVPDYKPPFLISSGEIETNKNQAENSEIKPLIIPRDIGPPIRIEPSRQNPNLSSWKNIRSSTAPQLFLPSVRVGAVRQVENIYLKN